jgi:ABC-2 type transport system ATP-binding protein
VVTTAAAPDAVAMIESTGLTKRLGGRTVVSDVSFHCEPGTVTGFLGPNGAGKTTTMRMLVGLSEPDAGASAVLGVRYRELPNPGRRVGVLLDASAQHGGRRGSEALAVSAQMMGVDARRVDELLGIVGLNRSAARKRVRQYSLGMRQRLGLAHALLGDPEVLILRRARQRPRPGGHALDARPAARLAECGGTVLLSSHLLLEVEAVADHLVIIGDGRIVAQGLQADLLAGAGTLVRATDTAALGAALAVAGLDARPADDGAYVVDADPEQVGHAALTGGVVLTRLAPAEGAGLEQLFFDLTKVAA